MSQSASLLQRAAYVACNVYVSAGSEKGHQAILLSLLANAQNACVPGKVGVVDAYADKVYNRSSFHLVGQAEHLARVAASLAKNAFLNLRAHVSSTRKEKEHDHPYVGLVDHVSIMPVEGHETMEATNNDDDFVPTTLSGVAARYVGMIVQDAGVQVYYYGSAHPQGASLARVRREKTKFFQSGGLSDGISTETTEVATVGAPSCFVENYNIRLKASCPKTVAQSLTKLVRERDGGLMGVEALTLPYSDGRWEVACNLLRPDVASADDIDRVVAEWENKVGQNHVETAYRVGTTAEQCLRTITDFDDTMWTRHNVEVEERFRSYLA